MANVKIYESVPHIFALAPTVSAILTFTIFHLEKYAQVTENKFAMTPFDGKCQNCKRLPQLFALVRTVLEILTFEMLDLQKVGQGHEVQFHNDSV